MINELTTFGFGLNDSGDISKSFLHVAYISVFKERKVVSGVFAVYFSATSFWIMKYADILKKFDSITFDIILLLTLYGREPKKRIFFPLNFSN